MEAAALAASTKMQKRGAKEGAERKRAKKLESSQYRHLKKRGSGSSGSDIRSGDNSEREERRRKRRHHKSSRHRQEGRSHKRSRNTTPLSGSGSSSDTGNELDEVADEGAGAKASHKRRRKHRRRIRSSSISSGHHSSDRHKRRRREQRASGSEGGASSGSDVGEERRHKKRRASRDRRDGEEGPLRGASRNEADQTGDTGLAGRHEKGSGGRHGSRSRSVGTRTPTPELGAPPHTQEESGTEVRVPWKSHSPLADGDRCGVDPTDRIGHVGDANGHQIDRE